MLLDAEWIVQSKREADLSANRGVTVREYQTDVGPADYVLFVDPEPCAKASLKKPSRANY
jgi:type I restriction enzyme R subunit